LQGISQGGSSSFSGEQIFRGLYFGEAPVAQLFPDIWASDEATLPLDTKEKVLEWDNLKQQVVAEVNWINYLGFAKKSMARMQIKDY